MFFLYYLFLFTQGDSDFYGVMYEDDERTILKKAPPNLKEYEIPSSVKIIRGGKPDYGPFYECINNLKKLTFAPNSNLIEIEPYGLAYLKVEAIDLSPCEKLEELGHSSFRFCGAKTFILPPFIKIIKSGALNKMTKLTSIKFPDSLETLDKYSEEHSSVFGYCSSLQNVKIGNDSNLTEIGNDCFAFTGLTRFRIPKKLQKIGGAAFLGCNISIFDTDPENDFFSGDRGILFNKKNTTIYFCSLAMTGNYTIPNTVNTLYSSSFRDSLLTNIIIGPSVRQIGYLSMSNSSIEYINIPSSVTSINSRAFKNCIKLKAIDFHPNITVLNEGTFCGCSMLEQIILPNRISSIEKEAFMGCSNVDLIYIPESVTVLEESIFAKINETAKIVFGDGSPFFEANHYIYSNDKKRLVLYIGSETNLQIIIDSNVEVIGGSAFAGKTINSIIFENESRCKIIEDSAFEECKGMFSISIPKSVQIIGNSVFKNSDLQSVSFKNQAESLLKYINESSFEGTKIESISFPSLLESIGDSSFSKCFNLTKVTFTGSNIKTIGSKSFSNTGITSIRIVSSVETIGENSFSGSSLSSVTFDNPAITIIGARAFSNCKSLVNVILEEGTKEIQQWAFLECDKLSRFEISKTVETIGQGAFEDCINLEEIIVCKESLLSLIDPLAFAGCSHLEKFFIPEDNKKFLSFDGLITNFEVTQVLLYLPGYNSSLCNIPRTIKTISDYAFQGAFYLETIDFEGCGNVDIKFRAFYGCPQLKSIILNDAIKSIAIEAFGNCPNIKCGSIIHDKSLRPLFDKIGLLSEIYLPCPTMVFTVKNSLSHILGFCSSSSIFTLYSYEAEEEREFSNYDIDAEIFINSDIDFGIDIDVEVDNDKVQKGEK